MKKFRFKFDNAVNSEMCVLLLNDLKGCVENEIYLIIDFSALTHAKIELLTIIVSGINHLKLLNKKIQIEIIDSSLPEVNRYISRINFFKLLGIDKSENFTRHDTLGSLIEIKEITKENRDSTSNEILKILDSIGDVPRNMLECLCFCLVEIIDNIDRHSETDCNGLVGAQVFKDEIVLMIIDNGVGIKNALSKKETGEYSNISNLQALKICTNLGVSGSSAGGKGLFFIKEFIQGNKGLIHLCSGENIKIICKGSDYVLPWSSWQGTYLFLRFKKNQEIDFDTLFTNYGYNNGLNDLLDVSLDKYNEIEDIVKDEHKLW